MMNKLRLDSYMSNVEGEKKKEGKPGEIGGKMEMKKAWKMNAVKTCDHTD